MKNLKQDRINDKERKFSGKNREMKKFLLLILIFWMADLSAQSKESRFYNETGEELSEEEFLQRIDHSQNLDLYFERDSVQYGILVTRGRFGKLDESTFKQLKAYLHELSDVQVDSTKNIVINYLNGNSLKTADLSTESNWNIFDRDYLRKLHSIAEIEQFWIISPKSGKLELYHQGEIAGLEDKDGFLAKLFFPYEVNYGNYLLIKPDGRFYSYLGEYGKQQVWENAESYF